jgi:phosphoribosylaminoimidazole-succinocarboxamide synthase
MASIRETNFQLPGQTAFYRGKVRDVYTINHDILVMVASDRISAFDVILKRGIPHKGQVLNQLASRFLDLTSDIVPNWKLGSPDPNVTIGYRCEPFKVEMVIRGYLTGHAWRTYKSGLRTLCGVSLPDGLKEHDRLPYPIITPSTKADAGHDEDISRDEILRQGIVTEAHYATMEAYTHALFKRGTQIAAENNLILVDTKYEFGLLNGQVCLMDEIHTPDSSRYFIAEGFDKRQAAGQQQKQLSKEFVREWLIQNNFMGRTGDIEPVMTDEFVQKVSSRYIELFEQVTGENFDPAPLDELEQRVFDNVEAWLEANL